MVKPLLRGRQVKKTQRRTPGSQTATHYRKKKARAPSDPRTGKPLQGVAVKGPAKARALPKSQRKVSRPYGGHLSAESVDSLIRYATRQKAKNSVAELSDVPLHRDLTLEKYLPSGWEIRPIRSAAKWKRPQNKAPSPEKAAKKKEAAEHAAKKKAAAKPPAKSKKEKKTRKQ